MTDFYKLQEKILSFLDYTHTHRAKDISIGLKTSDALYCAQDRVRNQAFYEALKQVVQHDSVVVDAGSGTGILGFFALALGAHEVHLIESNPQSLEISRGLAEHLGYSERCYFHLADAREIRLDTHYDILISETLTSGFSGEDFPEIIQNLKRDTTLIIPQAFGLIIKEYNMSHRLLSSQSVSLESHTLPSHYPLKLHPDTESLEIYSLVKLYWDISIKSGDCSSFMNIRTVRVSDGHRFFRFEKTIAL